MVREISAEEVLPLRNQVLRNNAGLEKSRFEEDTACGTLHLGYFQEGNLLCIATFIRKPHPNYNKNGYQLRGMATDPSFAGKGYGSLLIKEAIKQLSAMNAGYVWCNARSSAAPFYEKLGFQFISGEFIIETIGPHFEMLLDLNSQGQ